MCDKSMKNINQAFASIKTLAEPNFKKPFTIYTNASDLCIREIFSQKNEQNNKQLVAYFSHALSNPGRRYAVTRKEMLALVDLLKHFRIYKLG